MQIPSELYSDEGPERCGFILKENDEWVEVTNIAAEPELGFEVSGEDIFKYMYVSKGTWHTHPGQSSNLSMNDYEGFFNFKAWDHYILGNDGYSRYYFNEEGKLLCEEK